MTGNSTRDVEGTVHQMKWLFIGMVACFIIPLVIAGVYFDKRFSSVESQMRYTPPTDNETDASESEWVTLNAVQGQSVYVPAYSHVYHQDGAPYLVTITLSVRNTSLDHAILINAVKYFDTDGNEVKGYLAKPRKLEPLATMEFFIERNDSTGGSGANFLVDWIADKVVSEPIVEALMVDTTGQQGISFVSRGVVISEMEPGETRVEASETED